MTSTALRTTRADHARGIPMAMLIGLQPPIAPAGKAIDPDPPPAGRAHTKVCNSTLYRAHDLLTRLGPCEAKAIAKETGWSKSHTSYTLRAMAELGMATSRPLTTQVTPASAEARQGRRLEAIVR